MCPLYGTTRCAWTSWQQHSERQSRLQGTVGDLRGAVKQTLRGAERLSVRGGTNPQQVGLGVDLGAITTIHTPGSLQSTGVESDVAIEGNGFSSCQTAIRRSIPGRAYLI